MAEYELVMVARAVKKGDGFTEAAKDVDQLNKKVKESGQGAENFGKKLNGVLEGVQKGFGAALGAVVTFKKAFDYSREGAELNQLTDSFELLNKSVLQTPDLLDDMRRAAGGTIKDTELQAGVLKLVAGATGEYAQTLANISPQLLEIARASNKLNPSLGDTAFLYESLTTAAKRQSVPIADNLGLIIKMDDAVKKVHPSLQNLASSYDQLTDQQKFLNELLFQGGNLIDQVGGDVNSQADAWARLEVQVGTAVDRFKQFEAVRLEGVVGGLVGVLDNGASAWDKFVVSGAEFNKMMFGVQGVWGPYADKVRASTEEHKRFIEAVSLTEDELRDLTPAIEEATAADQLFTKYQAGARVETVARTEAAVRGAGGIDAYRMGVERSLTTEEAMAVALRNTEAAQEASTEAAEAQTKAVEESIARKEENARVTAELAAAEGDYFTAAITASDQQLNLNQILYDAADAAGADALALAGLMSATGEYTKEQINAALQTAATTAKAQELAQQLADGTITVGEARDALADFAQEWTASASITVEEDKFRGLLRSLIEFDGRTFRATAAVDTQGSVPSSGGGSGKGGEKGGEADYDPNKKHAAGTGGWLTVPPGFPNDTYTVGLTSGEKYAAIPSGVGMASALGGGGSAAVGGNTYIDRRTTVINANTKEAAALAMATVAERRRKNLDTYMGVG